MTESTIFRLLDERRQLLRNYNPRMDSSSYVNKFSDSLATDFQYGTAIIWDAVFSLQIQPPAGLFGRPGDHIFVTAWNRAAYGCEALLAYFEEKNASLRIFDHSTDTYAAKAIELASLSAFTSIPVDKDINAVSETVLSITLINETYQIGDKWINSVSVAHPILKKTQTLYTSNPYVASLDDQRITFDFDGKYGPSVEPSCDPSAPFLTTYPFGWTNPFLTKLDSDLATWSSPVPITDDNATLNDGAVGLLNWLKPNAPAHALYSFP